MGKLIDLLKKDIFRLEKFDPRIIFALYLIAVCATHSRIENELKLLLCIFGFSGIVFRNLLQQSSYWFFIFFLLAVNLYFNFMHSANHFYLLTYTSLALAVQSYLDFKKAESKLNLSRSLLIITFFLAGFHKLYSANFLSGRLLATYFLKGGSFTGVVNMLFPGFSSDAISDYRSTFQELKNTVLIHDYSLSLNYFNPDFILFCKTLSIIIIIFEIIVFLFFAIKKLHYSKWSGLMVLLFVWGTFLFRNEFGFFSIICILFLLSRPKLAGTYKILLSLSVFLFLGMEIAGIHPII